MSKQFWTCKNMKSYSLYTTDELKKIRRNLEREYRGYFYGETWDRVKKNFNEYNHSRIKEISNQYVDMLDALEYEINKRDGVYKLHEVNNSQNKLMGLTLSNDFKALQEYQMPIDVKINVETIVYENEIELNDIKDIKEVLNEIKRILDIHRLKRKITLYIDMYVLKDGLCVEIYRRAFAKG